MPAILRPCLLTIVLISVTLTGYGQSKDLLVKAIRQSFQQTNNDQTLKIVKLENEEFLEQMTDGGGSLTGYFKKDTICRMHLWIGLSSGVRQFDYYFNRGKLCFVYETEEEFTYDDQKGSMDYTKLKPVFEGRYYINNGKLIETKIKGKKPLDEQDIALSMRNWQTNINDYSKALIARLHHKR